MSEETFKTISDFGWDAPSEDTSDVAFFGEGEPSDDDKLSPDAVLEDIKSDDLPDTATEEEKAEAARLAEEKAREGIEDSFFSESGDDSGDSDDEGSDNNTGKPKTDDTPEGKPTSLATLNLLKEKGYVEYELEEGEELTEAKAEELLEEGFETGIESRVEELIKDLPPIVKQLNQYALKGGDISKFLSSIKETSSSAISQDLDLSVEDNQVLMMKESLKSEGYDAEDIEAQIEYYKESGKLATMSEKRFEKWVEQDKSNRENLVKERQEAVKVEKTRTKEMKETISSLISEKKEINGFKFNKKDTSEIPAYLSEKSVKLNNGKYTTQFQADLHKSLTDPEKALTIAKIIRDDFDFSKLEKSITTKVTKETREKATETGKKTPTGSGSRSSQNKLSLSELLSD